MGLRWKGAFLGLVDALFCLHEIPAPKVRYTQLFNPVVDIFYVHIILNHMVEYFDDSSLSETLKAVSDQTRRSLLTRLSQHGPCRVTDLADDYDMSLNAISKHIKVLERAGLVTRRQIGRTHWIEADLKNIGAVGDWIEQLTSIWKLRLDRLDEIMKKGEPHND